VGYDQPQIRRIKDVAEAEPMCFPPEFRDAVRRVTERGRSQQNARGRGRVDIDTPWVVLGENRQVISRRQAQGRPWRPRGALRLRQHGAGKDLAEDAIYSKLKVTAARPGYCHVPIAYRQEFFNQLTSEEVRTRFVRGHPVRYWYKPSGKRNEALALLSVN